MNLEEFLRRWIKLKQQIFKAEWHLLQLIGFLFSVFLFMMHLFFCSFFTLDASREKLTEKELERMSKGLHHLPLSFSSLSPFHFHPPPLPTPSPLTPSCPSFSQPLLTFLGLFLCLVLDAWAPSRLAGQGRKEGRSQLRNGGEEKLRELKEGWRGERAISGGIFCHLHGSLWLLGGWNYIWLWS